MNKVCEPEAAYAVALAELPDIGPTRLRALLADMPPGAAWEAIVNRRDLPSSIEEAFRRYPKLRRQWLHALSSRTPAEALERYREVGVRVLHVYDPDFPTRLAVDPLGPSVLFAHGDLAALEVPDTAALIGTRRSTHEGRSVARRFGRELTDAGVAVASGLALGIDGAAHEGALQASAGAPPVAVVGSGLDRVYPRRHFALWEAIRDRGLLLSEYPLGTDPIPWRFPARNRIIAALASVVVVVESHGSGGALLTVNEAASRGVPVMAVPGSVRNPASQGSNALLADGCEVALDTSDILTALSISCSFSAEIERREPPNGDEIAVLEAAGFEPATTDGLLLRTGLPLEVVATALARLQQTGWLAGSGGWWHRV